MSLEEAAEGIIRIAASTMSSVVKRVTTERGLDARDFPMVAFGGAGPLHAVLVARELQMPKVIIPNAPGHFSAYGMLVADLRRDYVKTRFLPLEQLDFDLVNNLCSDMEQQGQAEIRQAAVRVGDIHVERALDMRYVGQEHAVTVEIPIQVFEQGNKAEIKRLFDSVHLQRYGYSSDAEKAEIVSIRTSVVGQMPKPVLATLPSGGMQPKDAAALRPIYFSAEVGWQDAPVYQRDLLQAGNRIEGPCLIEEYASTTVVMPGDRVEVDEFGNLIIEVNNHG
jgi:N-methylhydantoinase A